VTKGDNFSSFLTTNLLNHLNQQVSKAPSQFFQKYPTLSSDISNTLLYPLRKLFNLKLLTVYPINLNLTKSNFISQNLTSSTSSLINNTFNNLHENQKFLINHSSNNSILPSDQSIRQYTNVSSNLKNLNLDETNDSS